MASTATFPPHATRTPRGTKRGADNSVANDERLAKRFDLLHLGKSADPAPVNKLTQLTGPENGSRLYIPVTTAPLTLSTDRSRSSAQQSSPTPALLPASPRLAHSPSNSKLRSQSQSPKPGQNRGRSNATSAPSPSAAKRPSFSQDGDGMSVDSTPYRVYISNIDDELSSSDSEIDGPIYLPEIEKHLARIPPAVLRAADELPRGLPLKSPDAELDSKGHELVLFEDAPTSVTSDESGNGVRKAILEARRRARAGTFGEQSLDGDATMDIETPPGEVNGIGSDVDMDMDMD
jgi:hypothetical protein